MSTVALLVGMCVEPLCHLFGLPHPENLPVLLVQLSQSTHGLPLRRFR